MVSGSSWSWDGEADGLRIISDIIRFYFETLEPWLDQSYYARSWTNT